jgi:plastocyanin
MVTIKLGSPTATDPSGFVFVPAALTIPKGTTVVWTNTTSVNHTVTDTNGSFDSGDFAKGKTYMHTFTTAGTINYMCQDHPGQVGSVKVT